MAVKLRSAISVGGPKLTASSWWDGGESLAFAAISATTTLQIFAIRILPLDTSSSVSGGESLSFGEPIQRLMGAEIAFPVIGTSGGVAASSTTTLGVGVYHNFGKISTALTNAGGAITSIAVASPGVSAPMPSGQTFYLTVAAGGTSQLYTTSAAVQVGALSIPVTSITPSSTYAIGTPISGLLGGTIAFGWLAAGSGTPAFAQNVSVSMPAMTGTTNTLLNTAGDPYGSYLPEYPGDIEVLYCIQASSTFTVPTGMVTTLAL